MGSRVRKRTAYQARVSAVSGSREENPMPERERGRGRIAPFFLVRSFKVRHYLENGILREKSVDPACTLVEEPAPKGGEERLPMYPLLSFDEGFAK